MLGGMTGIAYAIAACALWALSFVSPVVLQDFSPYAVTLGRYATFSLASLAMVPFARSQVRGLSAMDWAQAVRLSLVGHLAYYLFLVAAIQLADVPGPTVVIGLLPLTVPIFANLHKRELPWRALVAPLLGILAGLALVHAHELQRPQSVEGTRYAAGIGLALAALACWTWYGIANANWLRARVALSATGWTMAQGIVLLPVVLVAALVLVATQADPGLRNANGEQWQRFMIVSAVVGLGSTWLATLCWSRASRLLPTTMAGQLIAFVPIAAVAYGSVYRGVWPSVAVTGGVLLLAAAVRLGVRSLQSAASAPAPSAPSRESRPAPP